MLQNSGVLGRVERIQVDLYGSLALTGHGHGTDRAVLLGLSGERPDIVDPDIVEPLTARVKLRKLLHLNGHRDIFFHENTDLLFHEE
jgi:L-serine dehydratase